MTRIVSDMDGKHSYAEAIEKLLKSFEEEISEKGWDQPPSLYTVSMGSIGELASLTVLQSDALARMLISIGSDLAWLVSRLAVNELLLSKPRETIMDQLVEPGFLGWILTSGVLTIPGDELNSLVSEPVGEARCPNGVMQRIVVFCDVNADFMTLARDRSSDQLQVFHEEPGGRAAECLLMLVQISLSSMVKRHPGGRAPI